MRDEAAEATGQISKYAIRKTIGWRKLAHILNYCEKQGFRAQKKAVKKGAEFFLRMIKQGLDTSAPGGHTLKPLSPFTLAVRKLEGIRGKRPLLARRDLRRSLSVKTTASGDTFVGVPKEARNSSGKSLAEIATIHEFGAPPRTITLTEQQRKFLGVVAGLIPASKSPPREGSGSSIVIIRTPARPFIGPVFDQYKGAIQTQIMSALTDAMNGAYGKI